MKALVLTSYGDPETCIEYQTVPEPEAPGAGEVLVQLGLAPINFSDILVTRGLYPLHPDLPSVIGNEGVGHVLKLGPQVSGLEVGDRVALPIGGFVWRERMVCPAKDLIALPGDADPQQLAMIRINPPTAYLLLDQFVQLQSGDYVAINAANSSIARWIVGFAKQKRVRVVGLVRRPDAFEAARSSGCDLVVLDDDEAPIKVGKVLDESRPRLALDAVGGEASGRLIKLLGPEGTFVCYAAPSYAPIAISPFDVIFNDLQIRGFSIGYPKFTSKIPRAIDEAAKMIVDGRVHVPITATYPLEEFKAAIAHALRGGKILLSAPGTAA